MNTLPLGLLGVAAVIKTFKFKMMYQYFIIWLLNHDTQHMQGVSATAYSTLTVQLDIFLIVKK